MWLQHNLCHLFSVVPLNCASFPWGFNRYLIFTRHRCSALSYCNHFSGYCHHVSGYCHHVCGFYWHAVIVVSLCIWPRDNVLWFITIFWDLSTWDSTSHCALSLCRRATHLTSYLFSVQKKIHIPTLIRMGSPMGGRNEEWMGRSTKSLIDKVMKAL